MPVGDWPLINTKAIDDLYAALPPGQASALITKFTDDCREKLEEILTKKDDLTEVASIAHKLVSIAAGLGMEPLSLAIRDLMQAAKQHSANKTTLPQARWLEFCRLSEWSMAELDSYLKTLV